MNRKSVARFILALCGGAFALMVHGQTKARETVRLVSSRHGEDYSMHIVVRSSIATYTLQCTYRTAGCIIPVPYQPYYLITESSPLGKYDLTWLKSWYNECSTAPTIGIVPASGWPTGEKDFMGDYNAVGAYCLEGMTVRE